MGTPQFNSYIDNIDRDFWQDFWQNLCKSRGQLRRYDKGDEFVTAGTVGRYIGYVKTGALKYVCYSYDGTSHVSTSMYHSTSTTLKVLCYAIK